MSNLQIYSLYVDSTLASAPLDRVRYQKRNLAAPHGKWRLWLQIYEKKSMKTEFLFDLHWRVWGKHKGSTELGILSGILHLLLIQQIFED